MALNSFVTRDGGEIGRAQALQARACKVDIDVRMNPILLKPNSDQTSQLIVEGRPVGTYSYSQYIKMKGELASRVKAAYHSLAAQFDVVILEGAGSASEINLKRHDIVNSAMAREAGANVILVGDIDRGGVFGSFVGTLETMTEWERKLVRGLIINKFRGNKNLLKDGLDFLEQRLLRPVLGVVPHIEKIDLPDEDSVSFKKSEPSWAGREAHPDKIDVAVIDTPRISNFTDIDPLRLEPDVALRVVRSVDQFGSPDLVILAGSKNVIEDLAFLRSSGLAARILDYAAQGGALVGICGGLQMLGRSIEDPYAIESTERCVEGLQLLAIRSTLEKDKRLARTRARCLMSGLDLEGYEIHHGRSEPCGEVSVRLEDKEQQLPIGYASLRQRIWGTYLHGLFDDDLFRRYFIDDIRVHAGRAPIGRVIACHDLDRALDRVAAVVRENLNMQEIYTWMEL
jgi:cobyric acid synthase CobQ